MSCRLCKAKSHIPLSCDEFKKENGVSERRIIEEARTEALIRTCGKCKVRILKEDGCNKVICTKCYAVLCDYCGKDITKQMYNHFDGQGRAPPGVNTDDKTGKCPLYDESHKRKDLQVDKAEKEAMAKVRAEHPDLSEEDLKIKFAKGVQSSSNRHSADHLPPLHFPPPHNHYRHHGPGIGEAAIAALQNREPGAALDAMFDGVGNMLDGIRGVAPRAVQQAREQGRQARESFNDKLDQYAIQQHMQHQQGVALRQHQQGVARRLYQQQEAAHLAQQRFALLQREAQREDLHRHYGQARQTVGHNQPPQKQKARITPMNDPILQQFVNGPQAADVSRTRQNDPSFGKNVEIQNLDGLLARGPSNRDRHVEHHLHGHGGTVDLTSPTQRRENNESRSQRTAELSAERTAERIAEGRAYDIDPFRLDLPPRMPGEYPRAPRRRNAVGPGVFNPWVAQADDQAYL